MRGRARSGPWGCGISSTIGARCGSPGHGGCAVLARDGLRDSLLLSRGRGAPHPLSPGSQTPGPVPIQSAPLRKLDLCSPSGARFVPPRNFQRSYFWRPCRSVAAWVIQLLPLLLASGGSPGAWARSVPPERLFLPGQCFGSLWAMLWWLLASQTCEGLVTGYRLEPQSCRSVVRGGLASPARVLSLCCHSAVCALRSLGRLVLSSWSCCSRFTAGNVLGRHRTHFS